MWDTNDILEYYKVIHVPTIKDENNFLRIETSLKGSSTKIVSSQIKTLFIRILIFMRSYGTLYSVILMIIAKSTVSILDDDIQINKSNETKCAGE